MVDILFALGLFSIATFTYLYQISVANLAVVRQANYVKSSILAENISEDLSMKGFGDTDMLESFNSIHNRYFSSSLQEVAVNQNPKFTARWIVSENVPIQGNRTVRITVSWRDGLSGSNFQMRVIR